MFINCKRGQEKGWKWGEEGEEHYGINAREMAMADAKVDLDKTTTGITDPFEKLKAVSREAKKRDKARADKLKT